MNNPSEIPRIHNPRFIKLLISNDILSEEESTELHNKHQENTLALLIEIVDENVSQKEKLCKLWGDSIGVAYVNLDKTLFQQDIIQQFPEKLAKKHKAIPLYQLGEAITVATHDPHDFSILEEIEKVVNKPLSPVFSTPDDIDDAIRIEYQTDDILGELENKIAKKIVESKDKITSEELDEYAGDQAVVEFTRSLLLLSLKMNASDIHIEPGENDIRVRFRVDGVLREKAIIDLSLLQPLVTRLKILANLDITEKRKPQDGRIILSLKSKKIDFRFSSVPTIYGEKVVLRILGGIHSKDVPDLSDLHFSKKIYKNLKQILKSPNGLLFVTGPTGSGKTTTLYAELQHLNKPDINIMTIEDPVEYRLPGINQLQVNPATGFDFATAMRAFLRQDPDVVLIGEIRDKETARIASQAALTGHLVLATMHTNSAVEAVTRLIEIGVEDYLVASSVIGVLSQRLVRKICTHCKEKYRLSSEQIEKIFIWDKNTEVFFYRGKGCNSCHNIGYAGRIAIHELFIIDDNIRAMITGGASIVEINKYVIEHNFQSIRYDGVKKVLRGLTTMEEIDRVTFLEEEPH